MYNFSIVNCDTDSISICKADQTPFSEEEQETILKELNTQFPSTIKFDADGYFPSFVVLKAKNYILYDGKTIKQKGSSLKSSTLEPALKSFLQEFIQAIIDDKDNTFLIDLYHIYVKKIFTITDIKPWCSKKTISQTTMTSERANETKIMDAIVGSEYVEGDRVYIFFKPDGTLELAEKFIGEYNRDNLLEKLFKTTSRFETIFPVANMFPNYKLKRNKKKLEELLNVVAV